MRSFSFNNKTVYIISPERWGMMKVSKHHYALELANRNCRVFFIEPPSLEYKAISVTLCSEHPLISLVKYKPVFRGKRLLPEALYKIMLKLQAKLLLKKIGHSPDVVWSFHGYLFEDLRFFGAPVNIFFAADQMCHEYPPPEVNSATINLAVSDTIFNKLKRGNRSTYRFNHGVHRVFVESATLKLQQMRVPKKKTANIAAGFVGNLRMEALDREIMKRVIIGHPEVKFIFWGSYKSSDLNLGGLNNKATNDFIFFLENQPNVELRGVVPTAALQSQMEEADLFWVCWQLNINNVWDGSNSHKLLEYLSTGKPVVSHYVSSYLGSDLFYMTETRANDRFADLFENVLGIIRKAEEGWDKIQRRYQIAIENSYAGHLSRIEMILNNE